MAAVDIPSVDAHSGTPKTYDTRIKPTASMKRLNFAEGIQEMIAEI